MFSNKSIILYLLLIAVLFGCSPREDQDLDRVSLRLQWFHLAQFAGFYTAQEEGFYADNNLRVTINPGGPDFNSITLVANGNETFGVWTADQILLVQSRGVPITILAAIYREDPNVLMVKDKSDIYEPKDFKGKKISTVFGRSTETVLRALLKREGITERDVTIEPFPFNLISFLEGNVDVSAAFVYDHVYQARKQGQEVRIIKPAEYGIRFYSDVLFARNDFIEKHPDIVQRFVSATLKGWESALGNKEMAISYVLDYNPQLDRESQMYMLTVAEELIRSENSEILGLVNEESIQSMIQILQDQNQLSSDLNMNIVYTNEFVETYYDEKRNNE